MERKSGLQARNFYGEGTDRRGWKPLLPILTQVARFLLIKKPRFDRMVHKRS